MKYRKLVDGSKVAESPTSVNLPIDTKCPKKWAFVDMETGDIWVHRSRYKRPTKREYRFVVVDSKAVLLLHKILKSERYSVDSSDNVV